VKRTQEHPGETTVECTTLPARPPEENRRRHTTETRIGLAALEDPANPVPGPEIARDRVVLDGDPIPPGELTSTRDDEGLVAHRLHRLGEIVQIPPGLQIQPGCRERFGHDGDA